MKLIKYSINYRVTEKKIYLQAARIYIINGGHYT
jgi:hypothetical protein